MKHQINKFLVILMISGLVLLLSGCPADPSGNDTNAADPNTSNENASTDEEKNLTSSECTGGVTRESIQAVINTLPPKLKNQFGKNLEYSFDQEKGVLTFSGFVAGKGNLSLLMRRIEKFEGVSCIRKIVFQADSEVAGEKTMLSAFHWQICEDGQCECAGECTLCPCGSNKKDVNENTNSDKNESTNLSSSDSNAK